NHAYKPYRDRVSANRDFLVSLLDVVAGEPAHLIDAVDRADRRTVAMGAADARPSSIALSYEAEQPRDRIRFPVYEWSKVDSLVIGDEIVDYAPGKLREIEVPWSHRPRVVRSASRPRGYLVLPGWPDIERRLADHGLRVRRVIEPTELEVETIRLTVEHREAPASASYQGLTRLPVTAERRRERRSVPAGSLWIPADQPDFEIAVQLIEPEAPDSLAAWGLLSIVTERKEYIDLRLLERLARGLLEDPTIRAEWEKAVEDPAFAADAGARWTWWYRRTKFWDETVGLLPVYRVPSRPSLTTEPWSGAAWSVAPPASAEGVR
ncbi:MAG TPA: hypothetical protein VD788_08660, partial [Candidatus Polarisedimenticolaceae bacterium]|nr:hypothetical protein [Candidatus Polarisedimenticolaceae bacterium]